MQRYNYAIYITFRNNLMGTFHFYYLSKMITCRSLIF